MKTIEILSPISLDIYKITADKLIKSSDSNGILGIVAKFGLLVFPLMLLIAGLFLVFMFLFSFNGPFWISLLLLLGGLLLTLVSSLWLGWILKGGTYKPEKSFYWWRLTKERMSLLYIVLTIIFVVISIISLIIEFKITTIIFLVGGLMGIYYIKKSFEVHEDVDYVANQELANIIGMEVDEKIQASYQKKDVIMLVTDKKIICASMRNRQWNVLNKKLDSISSIGIYTPMMMGSLFNSEIYMQLIFTDLSRVELKMDMFDKFTSNPDLFFKRFLIALDAFVLGKTDEKIASRRRVSVNSEYKPSNNKEINIRTIDLSDTVLCNLRDATPFESGRILEF